MGETEGRKGQNLRKFELEGIELRKQKKTRKAICGGAIRQMFRIRWTAWRLLWEL